MSVVNASKKAYSKLYKPNQTAAEGEIYPRSTLFAQNCLSENLGL